MSGAHGDNHSSVTSGHVVSKKMKTKTDQGQCKFYFGRLKCQETIQIKLWHGTSFVSFGCDET